MLILAADHGGFALKEQIKAFLTDKHIDFVDVGVNHFEPTDDYPDFAKLAVLKVRENPNNKAVLFCRSGSGEVIAANKFVGIRATLSWNIEHAKKAREHDDTNVLAIPADYITLEEAEGIIETWLATPFSGDERHVRRLDKITKIEKEQLVNKVLDNEKVTGII